jgi:hypothetical protein
VVGHSSGFAAQIGLEFVSRRLGKYERFAGFRCRGRKIAYGGCEGDFSFAKDAA